MPASQVGVEGVAIYMAIYIAMTIGMFAALLSLRTTDGFVETIPQLAGLAQKRPFIAAIIAILMFSFIGLPPLAGFFAKWQVFLAAIDAHLFVLAVVGVLASAVSAFYYLRIVKVMYFDEPDHGVRWPCPASSTAVMAVDGLPHRHLLRHRRLAALRCGAHRRRKPVLIGSVLARTDRERRGGYRLFGFDENRLDQHRSARAAAAPRCRRGLVCRAAADCGQGPSRPRLGNARRAILLRAS